MIDNNAMKLKMLPYAAVLHGRVASAVFPSQCFRP